MDIKFFSTQKEFREWLEKNFKTEKEILVGYYRKGTGKPSITWPQSVDEALCFGWIDGIRRSLDEESYCIRFTPRNPKSNWSTININRILELEKMNLVHKAGLDIFEKRDKNKTDIERGNAKFNESLEELFKKNKKAWDFFQSQAPSYKKIATFWVMSAKQEATRLKRMKTLVKDSEEGLKIAPLRR